MNFVDSHSRMGSRRSASLCVGSDAVRPTVALINPFWEW